MPTLSAEETQRRFATQPVARMATVTSAGHPHVVPVTFALASANTIVTAVDHKPKRTTALARLANIAAHPSVSLLVDVYAEDWSSLWWARADGHATVLRAETQTRDHRAAAEHLVHRYGQYVEHPPQGPVILVSVVRWSGWAATV